jgi:antitoxin PrlF
MITSRITAKAQTTVPQAVRRALSVGAGDEVAYAIEGDRVILTRAPQRTDPTARRNDDPFALFDEWAGPADTEAFGDL